MTADPPRVSDEDFQFAVRIAERKKPAHRNGNDDLALDLRDARTALAERDRELAGYRERLEARIDQCLAAEARVRVLEEVLTQIAESSDTGRGDGLPEPCAALEADAMWAIANAALSDTTKEEQHG